MPNTITPVRVFISSPGDLIIERTIVRTVLDELNDSPIFRDRVKLLPYAWEDGTPPVIGPPAQEAIDTYLLYPADADIVICLLWLRMGSPQQVVNPETNEVYKSGTEYEFLTAYRSWHARGRPLILLYRCVRPPEDATELDRGQADQVEAFFNRFQSGGDLQGLTGSFDTTDHLRDKLRFDLSLVLQQNFAVPAALHTPQPSAARRNHSLPVPQTPLIGRDQDLAEIRRLIHTHVRLVTLVGSPGIGKTRLGLQIAFELRDAFDDVYFVDLAPIHDPNMVITAIAKVAGVTEARTQSLRAALKVHLNDQKILLLLDNFEQVVTAAPFVTELLEACPQLQVLATSRAALRVRAERQYLVPPLAVPARGQYADVESVTRAPAVALFLERAQAVQSAFALTTANREVVAEICQRLDGLPLAIELAAARVKLFAPHALLQRLNHRLDVLTSGAQDLPDRQRTLRHTIDWSYDLLKGAEQSLFARLGVFVGGCTIEAVEAICNPEGDLSRYTMDWVEALLDKSLLQQKAQPDGELRFTMLETIREYAFRRLAAHGEEVALRKRHTAYYLILAETADPKLNTGEQEVWLARIDAEHDNLRAALTWALERMDSTLAARLCASLCRFWEVRGYFSEGRRWLLATLDQSQDIAPTLRASLWTGAGTMAYCQSDYDQAMVWHQRALELYRSTDDTHGVAVALNNVGAQLARRGDLAAAMEHFTKSLTASRLAGDKHMTARALGNFGAILAMEGNFADAMRCFSKSLTIYQEVGDIQRSADTLHNMGWLARYQGNFGSAGELLSQSLFLARKYQNHFAVCYALTGLGNVAVSQGENEQALVFYTEAISLSQELSNQEQVAECLEGFAKIACRQGYPRRAAQLFGAAERLRELVGVPLAPVDQQEYADSVETIRAELSPAVYEEVWMEGRRMLLNQAVTYALHTGEA